MGMLGNGFIGLVNCIDWVKNKKISSADFTQFLTASWALANHLTNWFATCLSVFYFFKIAKFSHSCFAWLKRRSNRLNFMDTSDFNTEAHKKAMKMVMSFLLLFTVHSSCNITAHAIVFVLQNQEVNVVIIFLSTLFSAGHSFILVLGNSKLRQAASGLLRHHKCL
ncbi:PREDICTED: taste receptor type 2 member 42-like [Elephantulus edwardii]|uniref:taste receptor type 2 member 42-like n=1 Tax=Elephantulus edwardii TaxID=28737 RepID=UPI0003F0AEB6|nr:PREDICTED: taste receptor type 2 member 42-like [Elephantulus edwardii]